MILNDLYSNPDGQPIYTCWVCEEEVPHSKVYDELEREQTGGAVTMMGFKCPSCSAVREVLLKTSAIKRSTTKGRIISFNELEKEIENCVDCQESKKIADMLPPELKAMGLSVHCTKHAKILTDLYNES
jgi:hypothetical protein